MFPKIVIFVHTFRMTTLHRTSTTSSEKSDAGAFANSPVRTKLRGDLYIAKNCDILPGMRSGPTYFTPGAFNPWAREIAKNVWNALAKKTFSLSSSKLRVRTTFFSLARRYFSLQKHERRVGDVSTRLKIALKTAGWHELWTPITQGKKQSFFPRSLLRPPSNKALSYLTSSLCLPLKAYVRDTTIFIHPAKKGFSHSVCGLDVFLPCQTTPFKARSLLSADWITGPVSQQGLPSLVSLAVISQIALIRLNASVFAYFFAGEVKSDWWISHCDPGFVSISSSLWELHAFGEKGSRVTDS